MKKATFAASLAIEVAPAQLGMGRPFCLGGPDHRPQSFGEVLRRAVSAQFTACDQFVFLSLSDQAEATQGLF